MRIINKIIVFCTVQAICYIIAAELFRVVLPKDMSTHSLIISLILALGLGVVIATAVVKHM